MITGIVASVSSVLFPALAKAKTADKHPIQRTKEVLNSLHLYTTDFDENAVTDREYSTSSNERDWSSKTGLGGLQILPKELMYAPEKSVTYKGLPTCTGTLMGTANALYTDNSACIGGEIMDCNNTSYTGSIWLGGNAMSISCSAPAKYVLFVHVYKEWFNGTAVGLSDSTTFPTDPA